MAFETPILFLVFNRPKETKIVFDIIKSIKPKYFYVASDGPRTRKPLEKKICDEVRSLIFDNIDWDCNVYKLIREENLGCGKAVSSAINWFFSNVDKGIILEDDCLPNSSFFNFCETLLNKYQSNNNNIMHISANNYQDGIKRGDGDYYFSRLTHIWGWATWKHAWEKYSFSFDHLSVQEIADLDMPLYFKNLILNVKLGKVDTWDIQWFYTIWKNNGINIVPNVNLVKNIGYGFGKSATHTKFFEPLWLKKIKNSDLNSIIDPSEIKIDNEADEYTIKKIYKVNKTKIMIKKILKL